MPSGAESVNDVIGSDRSFGASNEIDPELLLARKVGVATTCAAAGAASMSTTAALQAEMASDDHPLHLIRALTDLEDLLVAVQARDRSLLHVAEAAVDLERGVRDAVRELARVELRHRGLSGERASLILEPRSLVDEGAPGLDLRRHVAEPEADRRECGDRLAELLALPCVRECDVVGALGEPDPHRRDRDAPAVEDLEELPESFPARSE